MSISFFFHNLRTAYEAELDDLRTDSEGKDVLAKRLKEKRGQLGFLVQMMDSNPEMLAVVLHQGFRFKDNGAMEKLLQCKPGKLTAWKTLSAGIAFAPWAQDTVETLLDFPGGAHFMVIAAALEYLHQRPLTAEERAAVDDGNEEGRQDRDAVRDERHDDNHTEDHDEQEAEARVREEAGNDWLEGQGFDRKE